MTCVVDASMAAAWLIPDERNDASDTVLDFVEKDGGVVPDLFRHEIRNILLKVERRGRSAPGAAESAMGKLRQLSLVSVAISSDVVVLAMARTHALTAYDAAYLDVALGAGVPLATLDRALAAAARTCGVALLGPLAP